MSQIRKIGILGYGEFGKLLMELFEQYSKGTQIKIFSRSHDINNQTFFSFKDVVSSDLVIPSVPMSVFESVIKDIVDNASSKPLIMDVCSVKEHPLKVFKKYEKQIDYICTHPMFGPNSVRYNNYNLSHSRVVVCETSIAKSKIFKEVTQIFEGMGLNIVYMSALEHDELSAQSLFVTHLVSAVLKKSGIKKTQLDTDSFRLLLEVCDMVGGDGELAKDFYKYNKFSKDTVAQIRKSLELISLELHKLLD